MEDEQCNEAFHSQRQDDSSVSVTLPRNTSVWACNTSPNLVPNLRMLSVRRWVRRFMFLGPTNSIQGFPITARTGIERGLLDFVVAHE